MRIKIADVFFIITLGCISGFISGQPIFGRFDILPPIAFGIIFGAYFCIKNKIKLLQFIG